MIFEPISFEHNRKTTLPGLREAITAVDSIASEPPRMPFSQYVTLDSADRERFDQMREDYVRLKLRVDTREQTRCSSALRRYIASNPRRPNSRRGLMISAPMFYGKTELAMTLASAVERQRAGQHPDYVRDGEAPVVWLEMTEHSSGKAVLAQIIEFLCPTIELSRSFTTDRLRKMAVELLQRHKTVLLVIDEAHQLGGSEPSSIIKALQNESSATILLVGIDLLGKKAFGKGAGAQVTMRCDLVEIASIDATRQDAWTEWLRWTAIFDRNLPLCDHEPGLLTRTQERCTRYAAADSRFSHSSSSGS